jgi:hypothetical protein
MILRNNWVPAVAVLAVLGTLAHGQAPQVVIGNQQQQAVPGLGRNGFGTMPQVVGGGAIANPYTLSTAPTANPLVGFGSMGVGMPGYGMSTMPGFFPPFFPPFGFADQGLGVGFAYQGVASMTQAAGQYQTNIQQARILREQSRQMQIDTARRRMEFEQWVESQRPTYAKVRERELAIELDVARKEAPDNEILSGKALNTLLKSIISNGSGRLNSVPTVALSEDTVRKLNLTTGNTGANPGLLRSIDSLVWPESLLADDFAESQQRLVKNLKDAKKALTSGDNIERAKLRDISADYKTLTEKFDEHASEMTPSQFVETKRFLNQLNSAIRSLSDPNVKSQFDNTNSAKGKTISELVDNMNKSGLLFNAATPGSEGAYRAIYNALREFERSLVANR